MPTVGNNNGNVGRDQLPGFERLERPDVTFQARAEVVSTGNGGTGSSGLIRPGENTNRNGTYFTVMAPNDLLDSRVKKLVNGVMISPGISPGSFFGNFYETPQDSRQAFDERQSGSEAEDAIVREQGAKRAGELEGLWAREKPKHVATRSFIHPYALLTLYGSLMGGSASNKQVSPLYDNMGSRRYYEMDGDNAGGYARNPTTTAIINWGNQDARHRFPYAFTDFVFCKYWNRIQNNRMITLRRYPMPVPDSAEPANYDRSGAQAALVEASKNAFSPLATAITYFGEGTGNSLKEILKFSVGYEWKELEGDVWRTTSNQNESGQGIMGPAAGFFGTGLSQVIQALGILDDLTGKNEIHPTNAVGIGPDPYSNGPYENRIIGPINVINKVWKRDRGLKFTQDGLNITFEYVARPISGVNNKAIMIDLMTNMLVMTSSSGTFFGGAHRYRTEHPAVYPMRDTYSLTQLYKGNIFGRNGAPAMLLKNAFATERVSFMTNFAKDLIEDIGQIAKNFVLAITGKDTSESNASAANARGDLANKGQAVAGTAGRAVAAHLLKGATIPWIEGARALLTGEAVGDWHLTIGNPLNPIAMIGNLIVDSCDFEMGEELGPDDFPTSFKAIVHLKHGMGRDRDAVSSMFNRGYGRIYSLPDQYKESSADYQTVVDKATDQPLAQTNNTGRWVGYAPSGEDSITGMATSKLPNSGATYDATLRQYNLNINDFQQPITTNYGAMGWQMKWTL